MRDTRSGVDGAHKRLLKQLGVTDDNSPIAESAPEGALLGSSDGLTIEIYTDERVREFNESEAELAAEFDPDVNRAVLN